MDNLIEKIYYEFTQMDEICKLPEQQEIMRVAKEKHDKIEFILGEEIYNEIEDLMLQAVSIHDKNSFITGFKVAMNLMMQSKLPKAVSL